MPDGELTGELTGTTKYKDCKTHKGFHLDMKEHPCPWCVAEIIMQKFESAAFRIVAPLRRFFR